MSGKCFSSNAFEFQSANTWNIIVGNEYRENSKWCDFKLYRTFLVGFLREPVFRCAHSFVTINILVFLYANECKLRGSKELENKRKQVVFVASSCFGLCLKCALRTSNTSESNTWPQKLPTFSCFQILYSLKNLHSFAHKKRRMFMVTKL